MRTFKSILPLFLGILVTCGLTWGMAHASPSGAVNTIYVDADAMGNTTGLSWSDAYTNLQDALTTAISGTQIWVAEGVYYPDEGIGQINDAPTSTFVLTDGVALYGGFSGIETNLDERDWEANVTVLSGDLKQDDKTDSLGVVTTTNNITGNNSYHVVLGIGIGESAILDGFTITAGQANGISDLHDRGGGIYNYSSHPTLSNLIFSGNKASHAGGGMYNKANSNPNLIKVIFRSNHAYNGGGIYNFNSNPSLTKAILINNSAYYGGGIYNYGSSPSLTNSSFINNSAENGGAIECYYYSSPTLMNVTFLENTANNHGGGIYTTSGDPLLANVAFYGNSARVGGGIYTQNNPTLSNVVFSGNFASDDGGGMFNALRSPTLINVTFSGNTANRNGGGMYNYSDSIPFLNNVVMWGNVASLNGNHIFNNSSTPVISYTLIQDSGGSGVGWDSSLGEDGGGNIDSDPLFIRNPNPGDGDWATLEDNDYGDLHLQWGSPAIDTGTNSNCPSTDLDGSPRPIGLFCDMGAYESLIKIFLPLLLKTP